MRQVRSALLDCHPTISGSRGWHSQHYHPYHRSRTLHHVQQPHPYMQQNNSPYPWSNGLEYAGMPSTTTTMSWPNNSYASSYSLYDSDNTNPYGAQPPSYMQPDPDHGARSSMNYLTSVSRTPQNSLWLDQIHSASVPQQNNQVSPVYPLTPAESTKSYSLLGGHAGQHPLSHERGRLGTPSLSTALPSIPSNGRDTPPLSAVSHRSSHTWNTDTASHVSNASSRTSCGGSQDLSIGQAALTTCEDQSAIYPYPADSTSPQMNVSASALPIAAEGVEHAQMQQSGSALSMADTTRMNLHTRASRDSLRTASPISTLYGYGTTSTRSTRRSHGMLPSRLMTSGFSRWPSPNSSSRNDSITSQAQIDADHFEEHGGSTSSLNLTSSF